MPPQIHGKKFKPDCSERETHSDTLSRRVGADEGKDEERERERERAGGGGRREGEPSSQNG